MKLCPAVAELFHVEGQTDRHDKPIGHFLQFCTYA